MQTKTMDRPRADISELLNSQSPPQMNLVKAEGPIERFHKKLEQFNEDNDITRKTFANIMIRTIMAFHNINRDQLRDLISSDSEAVIKLFNDEIISQRNNKIKKQLLYTSLVPLCWTATILVYKYIGPIVSEPSWLLLGSSFIWLCMIICSCGVTIGHIENWSNVFDENDFGSDSYAAGYIKLKNHLKSKYGHDYFPIEEIKEELGIRSQKGVS